METQLTDHGPKLNAFYSFSDKFCEVCCPRIQKDVLATVDDIKSRWSGLLDELSAQYACLNGNLLRWYKYKQEYDNISSWVEKVKEECGGILSMKADVSSCDDRLRKIQVAIFFCLFYVVMFVDCNC